jgi:hypothetical protein
MDVKTIMAAKDDFDWGISQAKVSKLLAFFGIRSQNLLSFEEVTELVKPTSRCYVGVKTIQIDHIVGSEGRHKDFTRSFLPRREFLRDRWMNVDKAYYEDKILPPVKLYQIGDAYFVGDGNHRVSVARMKKRCYIDAEVTHLDTVLNLTSCMTMNDIKEKTEELNLRN